MSTTFAPENVGSKSNYLDILHAQADGPEYKIPIKKIDFRTLRKPTDIDPLPWEEMKSNLKEEETAGVVFEKDIEEKIFSVPKKLVEYIDSLIKQNRPLKGLRWDIQESKSMDDVKNRLSHTTLLSKDECDAALGCCNDIVPVKKEVSERKEINSSGEISHLRKEYVSELVPYLKKIESKKISYAKLMASLGSNKEMPLPGEPKELQTAREEYFKARNKEKMANGQDRSYDILEVASLRKDILSLAEEKNQKIISKAITKWNKVSGESNANVLAALLGDLNFLSYVPPKLENFTGLRVEKAPGAQVSQVEEKIEAVPEQKEVADSTLQVSNLVYGGKPVQVIRDTKTTPQSIQVMFNGIEIAKGTLTKSGPSIKVHSRYKAGFLLAQTPEQKAFEVANSLIKTFKL